MYSYLDLGKHGFRKSLRLIGQDRVIHLEHADYVYQCGWGCWVATNGIPESDKLLSPDVLFVISRVWTRTGKRFEFAFESAATEAIIEWLSDVSPERGAVLRGCKAPELPLWADYLAELEASDSPPSYGDAAS